MPEISKPGSSLGGSWWWIIIIVVIIIIVMFCLFLFPLSS